MTSTNWLSQGDSEPLVQSSTASPGLDAAIAAADRRRRALRDLMARHALTPTELAKAAGMPSPNAIYNFLQGRTDSLSQTTIERIVAAIPGAVVAELSGLIQSNPDSTTSGCLIAITMVAKAGSWRSSPRLPAEEWSAMTFPTGHGIPSPDLFAVRVRAPGADHIYPDGSTLVCRPITGGYDRLPDGTRIVTRRDRPGRCETTVRELRRHDGVSWLWLRTDHPEHQEPLPLAAAGSSADRRSRTGIVTPLGVVIASWQPEQGDSTT